MTLRSPRHEKIVALVRDSGFMPIEELAKVLDVTPQTIRRDINQLCEDNILRRYHGGAALGNSVDNEDYIARKDRNQSEKSHIADLIAAHIPENASLFMSIGTTIEAVAQALVNTHKNLCIITNNIHVASIMSSRPDYQIMITSGVVRASDGGITGVATLDFINQFKVDYAILSAASVEPDGSLLDFDYKEVSVAQAMMENARQTVLAVDHTKFGRNALVRMGDICEFDAVFTDFTPSETLQRRLQESGVQWHLAEREAD